MICCGFSSEPRISLSTLAGGEVSWLSRFMCSVNVVVIELVGGSCWLSGVWWLDVLFVGWYM